MAYDDLAHGGPAEGPAGAAPDAFCIGCLRTMHLPARDRLCPTCGVPVRRAAPSQMTALSQLSMALNRAAEGRSGGDADGEEEDGVGGSRVNRQAAGAAAGRVAAEEETEEEESAVAAAGGGGGGGGPISRSQLASSSSAPVAGQRASARAGALPLPENGDFESILSQLMSTFSSLSTGPLAAATASSASGSAAAAAAPASAAVAGASPPNPLSSLLQGTEWDAALLASIQDAMAGGGGGGGDFDQMAALFGGASSSSSAAAGADPAFIAALPRITLGTPAKDSLPQLCSVRMHRTRVEVAALPAAFGPSLPPGVGAARRIVLMDPPDASSDTINNASELKGAIAVAHRGVVSFATKARRAAAAGAVAIVIVNGPGCVWPFTLTDSAGEGATIPLVMVREQDKARVNGVKAGPAAAAAAAPSSSSSSASSAAAADTTLSQTASLVSAAAADTCPICLDTFAPGNTVVTLPCQHVFDEQCALKWLVTRSSCPLCRADLPRASSGGGGAGTGGGVGGSGAESEARRVARAAREVENAVEAHWFA